jgi:pSer/pThr/pTyr-binding forkhead associated (FHA) protein
MPRVTNSKSSPPHVRLESLTYASLAAMRKACDNRCLGGTADRGREESVRAGIGSIGGGGTFASRRGHIMAYITLRVLDGADRGKVFAHLSTPVTIGREEGNTVQLNDERISRFHLKIQEDQDKLVLTDLESTDGTRVNGEDTQLRLLRFGDIIMVGRSVVLYGSKEEIAGRLDELRSSGLSTSDGAEIEALAQKASSLSSAEFEAQWQASENLRGTLHIPTAPEIPYGLSPAQAAQLSEMLEYLHLRSRALVQGAKLNESKRTVQIDLDHWQELLDLQSQLAEYMRQIGDPSST